MPGARRRVVMSRKETVSSLFSTRVSSSSCGLAKPFILHSHTTHSHQRLRPIASGCVRSIITCRLSGLFGILFCLHPLRHLCHKLVVLQIRVRGLVSAGADETQTMGGKRGADHCLLYEICLMLTASAERWDSQVTGLSTE